MGTLWNRSGTIERHGDDIRAPGALAYFFVGATLTPMTVYEDAAEAEPHSHPVVADANGRWPDVFIPYTTSYDVRVTDAEGVSLTYTQEIPNPDPIELSVTVDPLNTVVTGMIHPEFVNTTKSGYVRLNGKTVGNAASSGTERANADTSALFTYLWNNVGDTFATVSGGRGASAAADYAANKTIVLPSLQGCVPAGLGTMGNTDPGVFDGLTFISGDNYTACSIIGLNQGFLEETHLPPHAHTGTTSSDGSHTHTGTTGTDSVTHTHSGTSDGQSQTHTHSGNTNNHNHALPNLATSSINATGGGFPVVTGYGGGFSATTTDNNTASFTTGNASVDHTHTFTSGTQSASHTHSFTTSSDGAHTHTFTTSTIGDGSPFNNMPLTRLVTWYIKL